MSFFFEVKAKCTILIRNVYFPLFVPKNQYIKYFSRDKMSHEGVSKRSKSVKSYFVLSKQGFIEWFNLLIFNIEALCASN